MRTRIQVQQFEYRKAEFRKKTKWTELEDIEITRSWVIRRYVAIRDSLPNILKWSQVLSHSDPVIFHNFFSARNLHFNDVF